MSTPPVIPVAGLLVPAALAVRIIAAMRGVYPTLTDGKSDDAAVRAVLKFWVTNTLVTHEGNLAEQPVNSAVDEVRQDYAERGKSARQKALRDADDIVEGPGAPPAPRG